MKRKIIGKETIGKIWSICMVSAMVLSSLLVLIIIRDDTNSATGEAPSAPIGTVTGAIDDRYFGLNVSSAGDINDDGYDDFIVGAPYSGVVVETSDWWNNNWTYRRRLSFDNSDQNENLTNFPVLVYLNPANFDYTEANPDARDLRFIDADGSTELTYHIEEWNSLGDSYVWVNVTKIDGNSNLDHMWMYYNNSAASNSVDVWGTYDGEFVGVWHLNDSVGSVRDSTANGHNGAAIGGVDRGFPGMVDGAYDFAGDDDYLDFGNDPQLMITGDITLEAWINIDTDPATYDYAVMQLGNSGEAEADNWLYLLVLTPGGAGLDVDIGHEYGGGIDEKRTYNANLQLDNWYYLVATRDASVNEWRLYIDGTQFDTPFVYGNGPSGGGLGNLMVCMDWFNSAWWYTDGTMDELRISTIPRSADWISAQYLSMTDNFISFGYEEIKNGTCGAAYIFFGGPGISGDITAGNANITINGSTLNDRFGWSVTAGDLVGDNTTDILVGAPGFDRGQDIGAVYIFDGDTLSADADGRLVASEATTMITGENPGDEFGSAVSGADDVNNDGFDEVIVGAPKYRASKGRAYIFFGDGSIPITASDADVFLAGFADGSRFGHSVSTAGDMNGDGYCDIIVCAPGENKSYIYFGGLDMTTTRPSRPQSKGLLDNTNSNIDDLKLNDDSYYQVAKNGKTMFMDTFNITGLAGIVSGATLYAQYFTQNNYDTNDNLTWALHGLPLQDTNIEITQSTTEVTPPGYDLFAMGVDTLEEVETLDISFTNTASGGQKNVFFDYVWIEVTTNAAIPMVILNGSGDFGWSVSGLGDLNGDGLSDVVIGAPDFSDTSPGQAHIKKGNLQSFNNETVGANPLNWTQYGVYNAGITESMFYGSSGRSMELNDTGGPGNNVETRKTFSPASNGVIEFYARTSITTTENLMIDISSGDPGFIANMGAWIYFTDNNDIRCMIGDGAGGNVPVFLQKYNVDTWYHLRVVFDSTSDTYSVWVDDKLKMGNGNFMLDNNFNYIDTLNIRTNIGGTNQAFIDEFTILTSNIENTIIGESNGDRFGYSVANEGNLNGDSFHDIIAGAPYANGNGSVYIFYGNDSWNPVVLAPTASITLTGEYVKDCFGYSVSYIGDINNDGQYNFIIGAPWYDEGVITDAGKAYIFFGPSVTYQPDMWINGSLDNIYQTIPAGAQIDISLISAGDNSTWWITLQNDGSENDTFDFDIAANMLAGWTWIMEENGTKNVINDGDFIYLAPGESRNYTLNISSPVSAAPLDESSVEIGVRSQNGSTYDTIKTIARIPGDIPEISDVQEIPNPQETGGSVNITCNITDDIGVSGVWINITLPGGGFNNMSMDQGAGDMWFYKNAYAALGLYQFTIWANDTSDNWKSSSGHSFTIRDTTLPKMTFVLEAPDPQETGGYVNTSCQVIDNVMVDNVCVNITLPGGGYNNVSMNPGAVDQWFVNTTYVSVGFYLYAIWANDTSNNWNSSSGHNFTIIDTTLPLISNVFDIPDPQEVNSWINISCDATDNIGVDTVWVNITLPGGGYTNISMAPGASDQRYYNNTFGTLGLYQYTIWANDTSGTWNSSSGHSFIIEDTSLPIISNVFDFPDPQETGDFVNISCDVTDNVGVDNVWVNISLPVGGYSNVSMNPGAGNQWFFNTTFVTLGLYQYTIWSNDTTNNWNYSASQFIIQDVTLPTISDVTAVPDPQQMNDYVNISAIVMDTVGVYGVWVEIVDPLGGLVGNFSMTYDSVTGRYYVNQTYGILGMYQYVIRVNDTDSNWVDSSGHTFTIVDITLPVIQNILDAPDPQELDGWVNITCNVFDNEVVNEVWVNISLPGGGYTNVSMVQGSGSQWFYNNTYFIEGMYQYTIWASDSTGNWNGSLGDGFNVIDFWPQLTGPGVIPASGDMNTLFNFTVNYSHLFNKVPDIVTLNLTGPSGGIFGLAVADPADNDYTDGKLYYFTVSGLAIGTYSFHFSANDTDGKWVETGTLGFEVANRIPTLSSPQVTPVTGYSDTVFNFTVTYTDLDDHTPDTITVNITGLGIYYLLESDPMDTDFTNGKLYYVNLAGIPIGSSYTFHFAANDSLGDWAFETSEMDAPDIEQRTAVLTSYDKTVQYSDNVVLNATLIESGTPIVGADVAFYIDINKNGIHEPGEYIGTNQTLSDGTAYLDYTAMLALGFYPYISSYQGTLYYVSNSTEIIFVDPKPAAINASDKLIEEGKSVTLNATLEDEDGNPLSFQTIEFLVDRNQNTIFEGGEVVGSGVTDSNGYVELTYTPSLSPGSYYIWAKYIGSNNYSVAGDSAILSVRNTTNNPPVFVTPVPDQIKLEDSPPWELVLTPYEFDGEDSGENLMWYITGINPSLYGVTGMNSSNDIFTFIPVENAYGNNEVTLWLVDSSGGTTYQTLWVNITPVNDRPRIESVNPITVHFDAEYKYLFYNYISDIEDPREDLVLSTDDSEHTTVNGLSVTFLYPMSMNGTTQNILVTVTDTDGGSTSTIVIIRVTDDWVPELEIEIPDVTLYEGETVTNLFDLDDYFSDPDDDSLFYVTGQSYVTIFIHPITHVVNITAPTDWSGTETVSFHAIDPSQARVEDIVLITVLPVNDVPTIEGVPDLVVRFDQDYKIDLTPYITDEDNNASELILSFIDPDIGLPIPGISNDPNDNLGMIINLPESMNGTIIQAQIWVSDGYDSDFTTINITVSYDYPPELIMAISDVSFEEDTALISAFNIHNFFIDIDDVFLIYTNGHDKIDVTINPDGSVDFSAPINWSGHEHVTFRASDDSGALVECTIIVSVIPVNDAPIITQIPYQVGEQGRIWVLDISDYLFDIDNDIQDLVVSVNSEYVSVVGYTLIFDYPTSISGDIVTITVSDGAMNSSNTFPVTLTGVDTPSSGPLLLDYIFWIILIPIILAALLIGFTTIKRKITAPFVEEVFLIANDGVLIAHNSLSLEEEIDKDILSGMLTGVKNLISDAFAREEGRQKGLHKLEFGEKNIMLEKADHFFICLVFSGVENRALFKKIKVVINELDEKYGDVFKGWTGDMEVFVDTDEILEPLLSLEELSKEERVQLKEARKRSKEAKELAIRELDIHLVNLLDGETGEEKISSSLEDSEDSNDLTDDKDPQNTKQAEDRLEP